MLALPNPAASRRGRLLLFGALYFAQGLPWGFALVTMALYLTRVGVDVETLGDLGALPYVPFTFKPIFGPLVDRLDFGRAGRRRPWLLACQGGMAVALLVLSAVEPARHLTLFFAILLVWNTFAAAQDVAADALAIEILPDDERGRANGVMWSCKYLGGLAGGAALSALAAFTGFRAIFLILAAFFVATTLLAAGLREAPRALPAAAALPPGRLGPRDHLVHVGVVAALAVVAWVWRTVGWSPAFGLLMVVLVAGIAVRSLAPGLTPPRSPVLVETVRSFTIAPTLLGLLLMLLVDPADNLLFSVANGPFVERAGLTEAVRRTLSVVGMAAGAAGSLVGGTLSERLGRRRAIAAWAVLVAAIHTAFAALAPWWSNGAVLYGDAVLVGLAEGMLQATVLALFMDLSNPRVGGTQFTVFMAASNLKSTLFGKLGGTLAGVLSPEGVYLLAAALTVAPLLLLPFIDPARAIRTFRSGQSEGAS